MGSRKQRRKLLAARIEASQPHASILAIGGDVQIEAASAEKKGPRKFDVLAYTGGILPGALRQGDERKDVILDLAGLRQGKSLVANLDHDPKQRVGNVSAVNNDGKELRLSGVASAATSSRDEVVASASDGFIWQASVEAQPLRLETIKAGKTVIVNGQKFTGPQIVARESVLRGFGFVSHGADDNTTVNIAATAAGSKSGACNMDFDTWIAAKGFDPAELSDSQKATLKAAYDAEKKPPKTEEKPPKVEASDDIAELRAERAAEIVRVKAIQKVAAQYPDVVFKAEDKTETVLEAHAIAENWTAEQTELYALRAARPAPAVHSKSHAEDCNLQSLQGALLLRAGGQLDNKHFRTPQAIALRLPKWLQMDINAEQRQKFMEASHRYSSLSFIDIAREAIRASGQDVPTDRQDLIEAAFSGSALTNVFSTSVNAGILTGYMGISDTSIAWTSETDVPDYKTQERNQIDKGGVLNKLPRGQTADHYSLSDRQETYKIAAYARQFVVDDQDLIDDRLEAIQRAPKEMGEAAARLRPDLVYALMIRNAALGVDSVALFHADHANLNTSSALSMTTLKVAVTALEKQQRNSVNLQLKSTHLLVPSTLKFLSKELANSTTILYGADDETVRGSMNTMADENLQIIAEPRLENGVIDPVDGASQSGSASTWYVVDKNAPGVEVAYLRGTGRAPQVRTGTLSQGQWGMWWDVKHSIGAKALDFLFGQKNTA